MGHSLPGFNGQEVVPMLYGGRISETDPASTINLGLEGFHYDTSVIRTKLGELSIRM